MQSSWGERQIIQVSTGTEHSMALASDGTLWGWGNNGQSRLGDGTVAQRPTPVQVTPTWGSRRITQVSAAVNFTIALADDGSVWAWGSNSNGRTGLGLTTGSTTSPALVSPTWGQRRIVHIDTRNTHSLAVADDGTVWAWGFNGARLGDGTTQQREVPVQVTPTWGQRQITHAAVGEGFSLALADDGSVWAWGNSNWGQVGDGHWTQRLTPVQVVPNWGDQPITQLAAGHSHAIALAADGSVWAWGSGNDGRLGDGLNLTQRTAVAPLASWGLAYVPIHIDGGHLMEVSTTGGDLVTRTFHLAPLAPGETTTISIGGSVLRSTNDRIISNQAWVTSPQTPITGLLPAGLTRPLPAVTPSITEFDPNGIAGNHTCNTDADPHGQQPEDSCDQVPALVPAVALGIPLGSLSGMVWVEQGIPDGLRDSAEAERGLSGIQVFLYQDGTRLGAATTDANGKYAFAHLPHGDYTVQFAIPAHLVPDDGGSFGFTRQVTPRSEFTSDVNPATGETAPITVGFEPETSQHVDAGVYAVATGLRITKESTEPAIGVLVAEGELSSTVPVIITVVNTGSEPVRLTSWLDVTLAGPPVSDWDCDSIIHYVLAPGGQINCAGLLPPMLANQSHRNLFTVTGSGVTSGRIVEHADDWEASTIGAPVVLEPRLRVTKGPILPDGRQGSENSEMLLRTAGDRTLPRQIGFTIVNTGNETLTGFSWEDITHSGVELHSITCTPALIPMLTVIPGGQVRCIGTLPPMGVTIHDSDDLAHQEHHNTVWVLGVGRDSNIVVSAEDSYLATVHEVAGLALPAVGGWGNSHGNRLGLAGMVLVMGFVVLRRMRVSQANPRR